MSTKGEKEIWEGSRRIVGLRCSDLLNKHFQGRLRFRRVCVE